jgi:hypothetical protein
MVLFNGKPMAEGIDKIKITLQPYLLAYLNRKLIYTRFDKKGGRWYNTGKNELLLYTKQTKYNDYIYLIIQAEYINPSENINTVIINALYDIIEHGTIDLNERLYKFSIMRKNYKKVPKELLKLDKNFIRRYLNWFIYAIKELEIFFDMPSESISIEKCENTFDTLDPSFHFKLKNFQKSDKYLKERSIIKHKDSFYSIDKHYQRNNSTVKLYSRKNKLLKYNNSYRKKIIENYPYDMRVEFLLTNKNTGYRLNVLNLECNSRELIEKYSPYMKIYITKYFINIIKFSDISHLPCFQLIYYDAMINPRKKYTDNLLAKCKGKYIKQKEQYFYIRLFESILEQEYKDKKNEYYTILSISEKFIKSNFYLFFEFVTPFGIYNTITNKVYDGILFDEEYAPLTDNYWLTPFGPVNIMNIYI